jgi:predicted Rossmann-fold nucleotide-binding protein
MMPETPASEDPMPDIVFSRHAQRRMKLYRIQPEDVISVIGVALDVDDEPRETYEIVNHGFSSKYGHPLKVVFVREGDTIVVVPPIRSERDGCYESIL